jgi:hypothetical protein
MTKELDNLRPDRIIAVLTDVRNKIRNRWNGSVVRITLFGIEINFLESTIDDDKEKEETTRN